MLVLQKYHLHIGNEIVKNKMWFKSSCNGFSIIWRSWTKLFKIRNFTQEDVIFVVYNWLHLLSKISGSRKFYLVHDYTKIISGTLGSHQVLLLKYIKVEIYIPLSYIQWCTMFSFIIISYILYYRAGCKNIVHSHECPHEYTSNV